MCAVMLMMKAAMTVGWSHDQRRKSGKLFPRLIASLAEFERVEIKITKGDLAPDWPIF